LITSATKIDVFNLMCQREGIRPLDTIAIGKEGVGYSQLVLEAAGLGVSLSHSAGSAASLAHSRDITSVLYLLGFPRAEMLADAPSESGDDSESVQRGPSVEFEPPADADAVQSIVIVAGKNRPGVMSTLLDAVASVDGARVVDLLEAGTVDQMLIVMLLDEPRASRHAALKEALFCMHNMPNLSIRHEVLSGARLACLQVRERRFCARLRDDLRVPAVARQESARRHRTRHIVII
jgi:hypothetical protein